VDFGWEWFWRADTSKTKTEMDGNIKNDITETGGWRKLYNLTRSCIIAFFPPNIIRTMRWVVHVAHKSVIMRNNFCCKA
jgi:hypothetical protein